MAGLKPQQLPQKPRTFVGRQRELDSLQGLLEESRRGAVVVALHGPAGVGKTALTLQWAHDVARRFPGGQLYVDLRGFSAGPPIDPGVAVRALLDGLNVPPDRVPNDLVAQIALYRSAVARTRTLIVIDNAASSDQARPLLPGASGSFAVVTSRHRLGGLVAREQARAIAVELLDEQASRALLYAVAHRDADELGGDFVSHALSACAGLPLALTLAAARIAIGPTVGPSNFQRPAPHARALLDNFRVEDRETDFRSVLSWSYRALDSATARMFRLLGLNPGPDLTLESAAALAGSNRASAGSLVDGLVDLHLLEEYRSGRYRAHDLVQAYAAELAMEKDSPAEGVHAQTRVISYYKWTSVQADRTLDPQRESFVLQSEPAPAELRFASYAEALGWFRAEHDSLLACIRLASAHGLDREAFLLAWSMTTFLHRQGYWHEYEEVQQLAVRAAQELGDPRAEGVALRNLGNALAQSGFSEGALELHERAVRLLHDAGDLSGAARTERALGFAHEQRGDPASAELHAQRALALSIEAADLAGEGQARNAIGWYRALQGNYQVGLESCRHALEIFQELDDALYLAHTLDSVGYCLRGLGRNSDAIESYRGALTTYRELGDRYYEAETLNHIADAAAESGQHDSARVAWVEALAIFRDIGHSRAGQVEQKLAGL